MTSGCRLIVPAIFGTIALAVSLQASPLRPTAGKPEMMRASEVKPGMKGYAWTVFSGSEPESVPVEVIGLWRNAWGPRQDIILARMGGRVQQTNVAGGMSGSPVYIDGKLIGAVSLRLSVFSPEAICGITPIELMLEIGDFDDAVPGDALTPDRVAPRAALQVPEEWFARTVTAGTPREVRPAPLMAPIETPLTFAGFHPSTLREFAPVFQELGLVAVQGGAAGSVYDPRPAPGWENALQPGDAVAGVLVSGDMNISGLGTVTYNDGKRVLAFGHSFFNLGPVDMPMSKSDVLTVLASAFQPNKVANATEIVGALKQDRHSGILGTLGTAAQMIPVTAKVRSFSDANEVRKERQFRFNVFVHQKWTPQLMMLTLFNSIAGLNDFMDDATYRLSGEVELEGSRSLSLSTMLATSEIPIPAPMLLAGWWGDKFNRLFLNNLSSPRLKRVNVSVDLLPQRRVGTIEDAWAEVDEVAAGGEVPVRVVLQPYRGERIVRDLRVRVPAGMPSGTHQILFSDAETLDRLLKAAGSLTRSIDLAQTVSLINQERGNNKLYVSLVQARPSLYYEDKSLPNLPGSVVNLMQAGRSSSRRFLASGESVQEQMSVPFDFVVSGSFALKIDVK